LIAKPKLTFQTLAFPYARNAIQTFPMFYLPTGLRRWKNERPDFTG